MAQTKTMTQTSIRTKAIAFQLYSINEQTVKDPTLRDIIREAVSGKCLQNITLHGLRGNEIHAKMELDIDYTKDGSRVEVRTDLCRGDGTAWVPTSSNAECPVWREATDWFMQLSAGKGLTVSWSVRFCAKHDELCRKFNLAPMWWTDSTGGAERHTIPNSILSELNAIVSFSRALWPEGGE